MSKKYSRDPLLDEIIDDLEAWFPGQVVSVYGLGSYFEDDLPTNWIKNDVDLVAIVDSLEGIPKQDWTKVRYERKQIGAKEVWIGFNSLEGVKNREKFKDESFANYEWSLLDLKLPENSAHLYGRDIRDELPDVTKIHLDYDDIVIRSLYHLNNSFKEGTSQKAMRNFTKGVFKFGFYLCVYFDPQFRDTTLVKIIEKAKQLVSNEKIDSAINSYLEESIIYRMTEKFKTGFTSLRNEFMKFVFISFAGGSLHIKLDKKELIKFLSSSFGGLLYLIRFAKKTDIPEKIKKDEFSDFKVVHDDSKLKIADIKPNMKSITIYGRIKEIYRKFSFERDDGSKGQGASFLLHDPSGDIRVVLWDQHAKAFTSNKFNINKLVKLNNAYSKRGRAGTEIHVGRYGNIILSPQGVNFKNHPPLRRGKKKVKKEDIARRIKSIGIDETKVKRIVCPFCGSLYTEKTKICGKCGEPLANPK